MTNKIAMPDFDTMPIGKLREYASHMQIPLAKTAKKDQIAEAIKKKLAGRQSVLLASKGDKTPPGHSKIIIAEQDQEGSQNLPVPVFVNGYQCFIPRGKEVIVPSRVVDVLNQAVVNRVRQTEVTDDYGRTFTKNTTVRVQQYPFQVLDRTEGEIALTALEISKRKTRGPRQRYRAMFQRWPTRQELNRAIEKGLIQLDEEEKLSEANVILGMPEDEEVTTEE